MSINEETKEQVEAVFSPKYTQSAIDLHKRLHVDTQPFTREALLSFTQSTPALPRDDPPPYPKIEHEVVQHLELPVIEAIPVDIDSEETEPPPYEETQAHDEDTFSSSSSSLTDASTGAAEDLDESTGSIQNSIDIVLQRFKTSEVASQTEDLEVKNKTKTTESQQPKTPSMAPQRKVSPEEIDCDSLSKDLVSHLSPSDKLHQILGNFPVILTFFKEKKI